MGIMFDGHCERISVEHRPFDGPPMPELIAAQPSLISDTWTALRCGAGGMAYAAILWTTAVYIDVALSGMLAGGAFIGVSAWAVATGKGV